MKLLIISMLFFVALRIASFFGDSVKKGIELKNLKAMDQLEKQIAAREVMHQELSRGEKLSFKARKAIQLEDYDELEKIINDACKDFGAKGKVRS